MIIGKPHQIWLAPHFLKNIYKSIKYKETFVFDIHSLYLYFICDPRKLLFTKYKKEEEKEEKGQMGRV